MTNATARKLHNGDEVRIKTTAETAVVLDAYEKNGHVIVETDFNGFTSFYADEIE